MKKLDFDEMEEVEGGVPQEEYCNALWWNQHYNWDSWNYATRLSFGYAWEKYCVPHP